MTSAEEEISMTAILTLCATTYWAHTTVPARRGMWVMACTAVWTGGTPEMQVSCRKAFSCCPSWPLLTPTQRQDRTRTCISCGEGPGRNQEKQRPVSLRHQGRSQRGGPLKSLNHLDQGVQRDPKPNELANTMAMVYHMTTLTVTSASLLHITHLYVICVSTANTPPL